MKKFILFCILLFTSTSLYSAMLIQKGKGGGSSGATTFSQLTDSMTVIVPNASTATYANNAGMLGGFTPDHFASSTTVGGVTRYDQLTDSMTAVPNAKLLNGTSNYQPVGDYAVNRDTWSAGNYYGISVATATYAINAGTLQGFTANQIIDSSSNNNIVYLSSDKTSYFQTIGDTVYLYVSDILADQWTVVPTGNYLTVAGYRLTVDGYLLTY